MKAKRIFLMSTILLFSACSGKNNISATTSSNQESSSIKETEYHTSNNTSQEYSSNDILSTNEETSSTNNSSNISSTNKETSNSNATTSSEKQTSSSNTSINKPDVEETTDCISPKKFNSYDYTFQNEYSLSGTEVVSSLNNFSCEGFAQGVTGGGNLSESDSSYIKVKTAEEFINAIGRKNINNKNDTDFPTRPMVVEVMNDIDLGWNMLTETAKNHPDVISLNQPTVHPTLKKCGVSTIYITGRQNLTIFSKKGYKLSHACFQIRGGDNETKNIMIRNLQFDGIWEWDDSGKYDNNDWDQFTIRADKNAVHHIWIDHCTFKKTYDGTIDIKYHATDITISWCNFIPYTRDDKEFMDMMNYLENNRSSFPNYNQARNSGATFDDMIDYASINKKVHLVGHSDSESNDSQIRVTYCNNYYLDCVERLPRLRYGKVHVYNNIYDASETEALKMKVRTLSSWPSALAFSENGSQSTCYGKSLLENCYINGINTPLRNNMKKVADNYVGNIEALYTYYTCQNISRTWDYSKQTQTDVSYTGRYTFKGNSTNGENENLLRPFPMTPKSYNTQDFKNELPYSYILYEPETLYLTQNHKVGVNSIDFDNLWLISKYENQQIKNLVLPNNGVIGSTTNLNKNRL